MTNTNGAPTVTNDARTPRRLDWRASLIVAPLLAASLAANTLFGVMAAPQVVGFFGHAAPVTHAVLAVTPFILGGPNVP